MRNHIVPSCLLTMLSLFLSWQQSKISIFLAILPTLGIFQGRTFYYNLTVFTKNKNKDHIFLPREKSYEQNFSISSFFGEISRPS